ncbi:MAG: NAD+ synthase [Acidobacteriota bacterium]|nr:NAD+ synthase [Acidobacteriota bacterium]MDE3030602.1 NAD+ synthase [Acidobacteriota bacterium]MDE3092683.1 NAD+ synthase [Acidobacteriota bacterium]MDE3139097.1 NAD+ synthase [Acidobacteriota bacterium]MDE3147591.1 NAD+ synthase [Acidobacteriota bacterium]
MPAIRIALAQMNSVVGGLRQNVETLHRLRTQAASVGAALVVSPELALTGYPPEDLLLKEGFCESARRSLEELAFAQNLPPLLVGTVVNEGEGVVLAPALDGRDVTRVVNEGRVSLPRIANALATISWSGIGPIATKRLLPNYDVFDEQRYFHPGVGPGTIINVEGVAVGMLICEDVWTFAGPAAELAAQGATLLVVANASPFARGRREDRETMLRERAFETGCPIAYVNLVGGQDELVFDGQSVVVDADGRVVARAAAFQEELLVVEVEARESRAGVPVESVYARDERIVVSPHVNRVAEPAADVAEIYDALVMGTRDYLRKNGFRSAILGLSGGVDSSLVAAIAVDAVGSRAVHGFAMPSRYSSEHSLRDAYELARRLDIEIDTIAIEAAHTTVMTMLEGVLGEPLKGLTEENLQSRIRGVLLMAVSNQTGAIVLTTGNKSEMATGYSTLYGDSAGGFAVIKDVPKTLVYELCRYRNALAAAQGDPEPIPVDVLVKAPSAELRPDQRDDQSLPPYDELDPLLELYVEEDATAQEMIEAGHDAQLVLRITRLVDASEYKRRQMPPGVRISKKAFGRDRRMPITNAFRPEKP